MVVELRSALKNSSLRLAINYMTPNNRSIFSMLNKKSITRHTSQISTKIHHCVWTIRHAMNIE